MYLHEGISYRKLADEKGLLLSYAVFNTKVLKYQEHGLADIQTRRKNRHYSKKFKDSLVGKYMEKGLPIRILARKYNIPTHETIRTWIIKYTKCEELKTYSPKHGVYTMKRRKVINKKRRKKNTNSKKKVRVSRNRVYVTQTRYEAEYQTVKNFKSKDSK